MGRKFTKLNSWFTVVLFAVAVNVALAKGVAAQKTDTPLFRLFKPKAAKPNYLKTSLHLSLPPLKPAVISNTKVSVGKWVMPPSPDDKLLSNLQVYPIPVQDVINVKFSVSRNAFVNVKVMDVLGNVVLTLFSQRVDTGDQSFTYNVNSKLTRGFYFVRVNVGTELVNKRISVL